MKESLSTAMNRHTHGIHGYSRQEKHSSQTKLSNRNLEQCAILVVVSLVYT